MVTPPSPLYRAALSALIVASAVVTTSAGMKIAAPPNNYLPAEDVELGIAAVAEARKQVPFLKDGQVDTYIENLGRRLLEGVPPALRQPSFQYSFEVTHRMMIASFGLPGGPILISRGMLEAVTSEGELAGVLAHELSHVVLRHATAQASSGGKFQIGDITGRAIGAAITGAANGVLPQGSHFGVSSYFLTYGYEYERQADYLATRMMAKAGYDPRDILNVFRTIQNQGAGRGGPQWIGRHPDPGDSDEEGLREDVITREAAALHTTATPPASGRFDLLKARLGGMAPPREESDNRIPVGTSGQFGVVVPSGESRIVTAGDSLILSVPANWERVPASNTVTFAPEGAFLNTLRGPLGVTHGVQVGIARSLTGDIQADMQALLQTLGQTNFRIQWTPAYQRTVMAGRSGLTTVMNNVSAATGGFEHVFVSAAHLPGGHLLYVIGLTPLDEAGTYRNAFNRVQASIQVVN